MKPKFLPLDETQANAYRDGRLSLVVVPVALHDFCESDTIGYAWAFRVKKNGLWCEMSNDRLLNSKYNPFGAPGDQLRLGSAWAVDKAWNDRLPSSFAHSCSYVWSTIQNRYSKNEFTELGKLRPSTQMPQLLRDRMPLVTIKSIECRRVHTITEDEAEDCGVPRDANYATHLNRPLDPMWCERCGGEGVHGALGHNMGMTEVDCCYCDTSAKLFRNYFNRKHKGAWDNNAWCWFVRW
jgi:hypothetical protein